MKTLIAVLTLAALAVTACGPNKVLVDMNSCKSKGKVGKYQAGECDELEVSK